MKGPSRSTRLLLTLALVAGLAVATTAGIAGAKLKERSASVDLSAEESGSATAKCKKGTRAVSGGFDDPTFNANVPPGSYAETMTSRRVGKRKWTSFVTNGFVVESTTAITYAYCSDQLPKLKTVSATVHIPNLQTVSVTARCPRGAEAVSGGFVAQQLGTFDGVIPVESRRVGRRGWIVTGNSQPDADLTSYAYCAKDKLGLKVRSQTVSREDASENLSASARCRKKERAISGGYAGPYVIGNGFVNPFESRRTAPRVWTATTAAYGGVDWDVFAYCLKKEKK